MDIQELRKEFTQLDEKVYGKPLVYLDNAATSLRPRSVVSKWVELSEKYSANIHRAVHHISSVATEEYESARETVAAYLNVSPKEIVFTSGTTASINLVAFSFGEAFVKEGDEIIVSESEHHSDLVPWQMMCGRKHARIKVLPVDEAGRLRVDLLEGMLSDRTKLVCVTHVSNVLGLVNPVKEIAGICHSHGCRLLVDGAQGAVHGHPDLKDIDCDFYAFSGHKMYAAPGTGVLYGKKELLDAIPPYMGGGEMVGNVKWSGTTYAPVPLKFEAGTQNFAGAPTLKPATDMLELMEDIDIERNAKEITAYLLEELPKIPGLRLYGIPGEAYGHDFRKIALFSFSVEHCHHEDLALILDKMGIALRSGQMCAEPLMDRYGVTGMLRASFAPYNTMQEAEYFLNSLKKAIKMLEA